MKNQRTTRGLRAILLGASLATAFSVVGATSAAARDHDARADVEHHKYHGKIESIDVPRGVIVMRTDDGIQRVLFNSSTVFIYDEKQIDVSHFKANDQIEVEWTRKDLDNVAVKILLKDADD